MIFYFSGCGNSRWIARQIASGLQEQICYIPDLLRSGITHYNIKQDEQIGFVFPVYSWAAPQLVERFVQQTQWQGTPSHVWFACTCGDEMGYTRRTFSRTLQEAGLHLNACFCFIMPETYLAFPGFQLDLKEGEARKIQDARAKLPSVIRQIKAKANVFDEHLGPMPFLKSYVIRPAFVRLVSDRRYFSTDDCTGCGKCMKVCPVGNVTLGEDHRPHWHGACIECMACYHYCPHNAIQYGNYTREKGQYHFPET